MLTKLLEKIWYQKHLASWLLYPVSLLYQGIHCTRKWYFKTFNCKNFDIPIIVVGNLTVGGTGKTPLVIAIAKKLTAQNLKVGIISRGYKATVKTFPYEVTTTDTANKVGDEPLLIKQNIKCPVVIGRKRIDTIKYLQEKHNIDIIISDDGLQHYQMGRSIEIAVIDGQRGLGNNKTLPAGPLREKPNRLNTVDLIVINKGIKQDGTSVDVDIDVDDASIYINAKNTSNLHEKIFTMNYQTGDLVNLVSKKSVPKAIFKNKKISAVAGIGNPQQFIQTLKQQNFTVVSNFIYPDHYAYSANDFANAKTEIIMTEKDAVKCKSFATENMYYVPIEAMLSKDFWQVLRKLIWTSYH